jgi:hypothetical protein
MTSFSPNKCPFCDSTNITAGERDGEGNSIIEFCECYDCGKMFSFTYIHDGKAYGYTGNEIMRE